ncbi:MAG: hypothetical protein MOB07_27880 [Acidobacteria bacterium]|nr:hypothetical protein [Acidobacteriota bacterium]
MRQAMLPQGREFLESLPRFPANKKLSGNGFHSKYAMMDKGGKSKVG